MKVQLQLPLRYRLNPIKSSNLKAVCYFRNTGLMVIEFKKGGIYLYHPVPWSTYMKLRRAESHGSFFYAHIRDNPQIHCEQLA